MSKSSPVDIYRLLKIIEKSQEEDESPDLTTDKAWWFICGEYNSNQEESSKKDFDILKLAWNKLNSRIKNILARQREKLELGNVRTKRESYQTPNEVEQANNEMRGAPASGKRPFDESNNISTKKIKINDNEIEHNVNENLDKAGAQLNLEREILDIEKQIIALKQNKLEKEMELLDVKTENANK